MKNLVKSILIIVIGVSVLTSCKKNEDDSSDPNNNVPASNTMTLKVNGMEWTAGLAVVGSNSGGIVTCTGSDSNSKQCQISIMNVTGTGTYSLGGDMTNPNMGRWTEGLGTNDTYSTMLGQGTGTVEITEFSDTGFKGTFSFTAKNTAQTEVAITQGAFNATFSK